MIYDHILIVGFGGPTKPEETHPFLLQVTRGRNIPEARLKAVAHHYERIGGFSPYHQHTFDFVEKLRPHVSLPIFVGMRNWNPFVKETLLEIKKQGLKKGVAFILSPYRSVTSCQRYKHDVRNAQKEVGAEDIQYEFVTGWNEHPQYIGAEADEVGKTLENLKPETREITPVIFSAHSIPLSMLEECPFCSYETEFKTSASLIAKKLNLKNWTIGYQSRSGNPHDPWFEPDVSRVIKDLKEKGHRAFVVSPIGFLCDNAEVLFDLDIELSEEAEKIGIDYYRAGTVMGNDKFVQMVSELVARAGVVARS